MIRKFPVGETNDLVHFLVVERKSEYENEWSMQIHSHPDFEEYWFVIEGKGQIICGDETYDVEPGDLVITPRGVPHKARGDIKFICVMSKHNVFGHTLGTRFQYVAHDKPYRKNPKDLIELGACHEFDTAE